MSVPLMGKYIAQALGQQFMAIVYNYIGLQAAWIISGMFVVISVIMLIILVALVEARSPVPDKSKRRSLLEEDTVEFESFVDALLQELKTFLMNNRSSLWSWPMQHVVRDRIRNVVPKVREWKDDSRGQEYMEDLGMLLRRYPEQLHRFEKQFPDLWQQRRQEHDSDASSMSGTLSIVSHPSDAFRARSARASSV